jgi:hypothetical protein
VYRIVMGIYVQTDSTWLANFAPMAAIALCGAAFLPGRYKVLIPLGALFVSDVVLNYHYEASLLNPLIFGRYLALAVVCFIGMALQNRATFKNLLPASLGASVVFYVISNAFSWLSDPGYVKSFAGFVQATKTQVKKRATRRRGCSSGTPSSAISSSPAFLSPACTSGAVGSVHERRLRCRAPRNPACHSRSNATKSKCSR